MFHDDQINLENTANLSSSLQGGDIQNFWEQAKLKSDENGNALKMASDKTHFYIFLKMPITFCFTNILFYFEN